MIASIFNWRTGLAFLAILIVSTSIVYSQYLSKKIALEEKQKVEQWVEASKAILENPSIDLTLPNLIRNEQTSIPIIETNEKDSIVSFVNIDTTKAKQPGYLENKLRQYKSGNKPITLEISKQPYIANKYYYGSTQLLNEVRFYPIVQLCIVSLFIILALTSIATRNRATQNQVWAGMAKETAHQLGTPISSLQGWLEMLKENSDNHRITQELEKDINRLKLVSDRFGKIGSTPQLEPHNIKEQADSMVEYIRKRAAGKVLLAVNANNAQQAIAPISPPLFDWVIENLLKNALDAMEGKGSITVSLEETDKIVSIDVTDTGKGISPSNISKVFNPGFTTKKRGWGLGLSLSKRIIEQYHRGKLFVKQSEPGKGTTFRIEILK